MFRTGQWCAFDDQGRFSNAFRTRKGKAVGVYHDDGFVWIVQHDGTNCTEDIDGEIINVSLAIQEVLPTLEWISDRRDIPYERIKQFPKDWQPEP